jgi:hypothetical protein
MVYQQLRRELEKRLDESGRGDRGWFVITRVHVSLDWVKGIADYLFAKAGIKKIILTKSDYQSIAKIVEIGSSDPGVQLRRHHLLVMDKPLQLIQRISSSSWLDGIKLTQMGYELANSNDPSSILEKTLSEIIFAVEPWTPPDRVDLYSEFKVSVYQAAIEVMANCEGYIDRDEFDLFLSRVRGAKEIPIAIDMIQRYRKLGKSQQDQLIKEVAVRMPSEKTYSNWRDMGLHTFSLFALGTSLVRDGHHLRLTGNWADNEIVNIDSGKIIEPELKIPEPDGGELSVPPTNPATNDGTDGESFVAKIYTSKGWQVSFYTNKRGFGFDLWARRENSAVVIEVKSSIAQMGVISLTSTEYKAAQQYGDNYILAIVEHIGTDTPKLTLIQNPQKQLSFQVKDTTMYCVAREVWIKLQV